MFLKVCKCVKDLLNIRLVPNQIETQEMCNEAVKKNPWTLEHVPD